jgi:Cof subfamily protein (haloacid dehalogenase superfamily)
MEKHLIFMDIDGTLVDNQQNILPKTKAVITALQKEGHLFYVATGRKFSSAASIAEMLSKKTQVVASNGSIYSINQQLVKHQLSVEALSLIYTAAAELSLPVFFFGEHTVFYTSDLPDYFTQNDQARIANTKEKDFIALRSLEELLACHEAIVNGIIISETNLAALQQLKEILQKSKLLTVSSSYFNNIELIPKGISKATAIHAIQKKLTIPTERIISFGDGQNDIEMLQASGVSVAMGNAEEAVKAVATHVTDTNEADGIANFLSNYFNKGAFLC